MFLCTCDVTTTYMYALSDVTDRVTFGLTGKCPQNRHSQFTIYGWELGIGGISGPPNGVGWRQSFQPALVTE